MALDYRQLTEQLNRFYDFAGKVVLYVGAGGRQLLDTAVPVQKMIAIDKDAEALKELRTNAARGARRAVSVVGRAFEDVAVEGDVVYFEFCLHEMADPPQALAHARHLAPDIVVFDHAPGSDWVYYGAEEDEVRRSSEAVERFGVRRREAYGTDQRFRDYAELIAKLSPQGPTAITRARCFEGATNIVIPMRYQLVLL